MNRQAQDSLNPSELSRKRTFQWLADAIPALACYVDASLRYRFMNTRYRKLFHLSETQDIQHLYMPGLMGEEAFAKARVYVNKVLSGEHVTYEIHLSESGEANRVLQVHYVPDLSQSAIKPNHIIGFFMMGLDVTELRHPPANGQTDPLQQTEHHTRYLTESLDYLKTARDLLIEQEKMASIGSLVTGVAHELNTPLGVSLTAASFLQAESFRIEESLNAGTLSAEQLRAFLRQSQDTGLLVATNIERTSALIQRFKELGATYSGEAPAEIKINELLQDVIRLAAGYLSNSGIQLHTQGSDQSHLITYPVIISKILLSLIENSVCHAFISPSVQNNPGIWLQAHYESPDLILHYRDNGCGLSEAGKKHIFDPFFSERRTGLNKEICHRQNTGLSMGIVYNLVTQALSGQIRLDHQEEKGFAVIIRFPVSCS